MRIGFDIDDTLNNVRYKGIDVFNRHLGMNVSYEGADKTQDLSFHTPFGILKEHRKDIWKEHVHEIYSDCVPLEGAVETLNRWEKQGAEIFYITARKDTLDIRMITENWLKKHGFPFTQKNFNIGLKDYEKADLAVELELDLFFEDKPSVIEGLLQNRVNFAIKDQCYNQEFSHKRVHNWSNLSLEYFFSDILNEYQKLIRKNSTD